MVHAVDRIKIAFVNDNHSWTQLRRFQHLSLLRPARPGPARVRLQVDKDSGGRNRHRIVPASKAAGWPGVFGVPGKQIIAAAAKHGQTDCQWELS
jgi:hypothetical protein